jgi:hypothetical protein
MGGVESLAPACYFVAQFGHSTARPPCPDAY